MEDNKLYVGNLSYSTTNKELEELCATHGDVKSANVIEGKGFGFVEFGSAEDAKKAKEALNGADFKGRALKVDEARPRKDGDRGGFRR